jgi:Ca2+-transporting ATPase
MQPAFTGTELDAMDEQTLPGAVTTCNVFARILPQQKLRIVNALKAAGEVVAMTGDGVNDSPSLKAAHIGIAMGGRGTDVAREASSMVLLDDDFGSIVKAIALGRRIYDNLRKAMGFVLAVHVPIAGLALMPVLLGLPVLFTPIHIAFLEMVIDPVCSLAFEAEGEERDVMRRKPRNPKEPLFTRGIFLWSLLQGMSAFAAVTAVYFLAQSQDLVEPQVRAVTFLTLVLAIICLIFVDRAFSASLKETFMRPNRALTLVLLAVFVIMALALTWSPVATLFSFGPLTPGYFMLGVAAAGGLFVLMEASKALLGMNRAML